MGCGDVITTDTTLYHDLVDCPDNGLLIGADHVTLDLNGHLIDGDNAHVEDCPVDTACDIGISDGEPLGHTGVTIKDGRVTQFGAGVALFRATRDRVLDIETFRNEVSGIGVGDSRGTRLRRDSARANGLGTPDTAGIVVVGSRHSVVAHNETVANGGVGLFVGGSRDSRFTANRSVRNPKAGLVFEGSAEDTIAHNHSAHDGDGIFLSGDRNELRDNSVRAAIGCGPRCRIFGIHFEGDGISFQGGNRNLIAGNTVRGAKRTTIRVGYATGSAADNVVRRNRVHGAGEDGIEVDPEARHTVLARNHAFDAGDDGLDVRSRRTLLTGNAARANKDLGIEAAAGVRDGGGNRASGNGDPRQCTNVSCS